MKISLKTLNKKKIILDLLLFRISLGKLKKLYKLYKLYNDMEENGFKLKYISQITPENLKLLVFFYNKYTTGEKISFENILKDINEKINQVNEFTGKHPEVVALLKNIKNVITTLK